MLGNEGVVSSTLNISTEAMPMVMATSTSPAGEDVIIGDKVLVRGSATFMDVSKGDQTISATGVDGVVVSVGLVVEGEEVTVPPGGTRANTESEGCACSSSAGPLLV